MKTHYIDNESKWLGYVKSVLAVVASVFFLVYSVTVGIAGWVLCLVGKHSLTVRDGRTWECERCRKVI